MIYDCVKKEKRITTLIVIRSSQKDKLISFQMLIDIILLSFDKGNKNYYKRVYLLQPARLVERRIENEFNL